MSPEPWEIRKTAEIFGYRGGEFYQRNPSAIDEEISESFTWDTLHEFGAQRMVAVYLATLMKKTYRTPFHVSELQMFNPEAAGSDRWFHVNIYGLPWDETGNFTIQTSKFRKEHADCYKAAGRKAFRVTLSDFRTEVVERVRAAENRARAKRGIAAIGEGWVNETDLFYRVKSMFPGLDVTHHGQPKWLGRQHLDIWIPNLNVAIEYHGEQHFKEVAHFGGLAALEGTRARDERKRQLCKANGVRLIEVTFEMRLTDDELRALVGGPGE